MRKIALVLFTTMCFVSISATAELQHSIGSFLLFKTHGGEGLEECYSAFVLSDNTIFIAGTKWKDRIAYDEVDRTMGWGVRIDDQGMVVEEYQFDAQDVQANAHLLGGIENDGNLLLLASDTITGISKLFSCAADGISSQVIGFSRHRYVKVQKVFPSLHGLLVCGEAGDYGLYYPWAALLDYDGSPLWEYTGQKAASGVIELIWADDAQGFFLLHHTHGDLNAEVYALTRLDASGMYVEDLPLEFGASTESDVAIRHFFVDDGQIVFSGSRRTFEPEIVNNGFIAATDYHGTIQWQREYSGYGIIQASLPLENGFLFSCLDVGKESGNCLFMTDKQGILREAVFDDTGYSYWPKHLIRNRAGDIWLVGDVVDRSTGLPDIFYAKIGIGYTE